MKRLFHYGKGFGKYTWCGLKIAPWNKPKHDGPNWGGALTESTNCERCLTSFIRITSKNLADAAMLLSNLKRKRAR